MSDSIRTAVVVDDEPVIRMDLAEMLTEMSFDVVGQGADGFEAVEMCRSYVPDLLMIDIKMPVFDGLSAADTVIREETAGCVILLTAYCDEHFLEQAKEIGVSTYLVKPVTEKMLRPAIEMAMQQNIRYRETRDQLKKIENELEEKKLIDRAKIVVAKRDGISEGEAYASMRTLCMNRQCSMAEISRMILEADPTPNLVQQAKKVLMEQYHLSENAAYRRIRDLSKKRNVSMADAARTILKGKASK